VDLACLGRFGAAVAGTLLTTARPLLDPARGAEVAKRLRSLGVKGILVRAAEPGYSTEVKCGMPQCFCPEELGGAWYFESLSDGYSDWIRPTSISHSQSETGATELSTSRSLPIACATGSTIR